MVISFIIKLLKLLNTYWKSILLITAPIALSPFLINGGNSSESKCAFVLILMAIYWTFEPIPLPITALLPVVLFPMLGLATTEEACGPYLQATNMLFLASLVIAISMECSGLHKRIALKVLMVVGNDIRRLFAGFMFTAMFLGIWIINTAATAMILPIADVISREILTEDQYLDDLRLNSNHNEECNQDLVVRNGKNDVYIVDHLDTRRVKYSQNDRLRRILYISIAYSATIGGTTTLTSNGPNLVLRFVLDDIYGGKPSVDYAKWLLFCITATVVTVAIVWLAFRYIYMRDNSISQITKAPKHIVEEKYAELGQISFHEIMVCILFILLIILWMTRDPHFMRGWASIVSNNIKPKDATAAMFIVVLMFCIPSKPCGPSPSPSLLDWPTVQSRLSWGVIILRGGGFSMAEIASKSGLTKYIGTQLTQLDVLPLYGTIIVMSLLATIFTELASNSAIATIFLPIAGQLASNLGVNPLVLMIPITLSCSYAFMLPVGTPANALVTSHANLDSTDMLLPGILTKLISLLVMLLNVWLVGFPMFNLNEFPDWAQNQ